MRKMKWMNDIIKKGTYLYLRNVITLQIFVNLFNTINTNMILLLYVFTIRIVV